MSLCMVAGVSTYGAPAVTQSITAQATDVITGKCYSFDLNTGVLLIKGKVDGDELRNFGYKEYVDSVKVESGTVFPADCSNLFANYYCTSINLSGANTANVTTMSRMFYNCWSMTSLNLNGVNTSNVTDMSYMFYHCHNLGTIDVSKFKTSKVTNMSNMFSMCTYLSSLDVSKFDTSKVTNMSYMFNQCRNLSKIDVSKFNTSNVTDMTFMFYQCRKPTTIAVSGFDTNKVTSMYCMFYDCSGLTELKTSNFKTGSLTNSSCMFLGCKNLTSLDLSGFNTAKVKNMSGMFQYCSSLKRLVLGTNFKSISEDANLPNGDGWVNVTARSTIVSGNGTIAVINNAGENTYRHFNDSWPTYPENIKVTYSEDYHQVRLTWDKVDGADLYGIAVYLAGKWRVQTQNITKNIYTSPKNLTPGKSYKLAVAARVDGNWDNVNALKNAVTVTVK